MILAIAILSSVFAIGEPGHYMPPRPVFAGIHIAMPEDSAFLLMRRIAVRYDTMRVDSLALLESDSVQIFGQPAYLQLQLAPHRAGHERAGVQTIVINWHPLSGGTAYANLRDVLISYMERYFGRGVIFTNESLTYHRWETEDGTSELSYSDKYLRIFVRLGKPR